MHKVQYIKINGLATGLILFIIYQNYIVFFNSSQREYAIKKFNAIKARMWLSLCMCQYTWYSRTRFEICFVMLFELEII